MQPLIIYANARYLPINDASVQCIVTSPPYWGQRDYGVAGQLGLETRHDCVAWARGEPPCALCYVCALRNVFSQCWRVLRPDGTCWVNLGDSYASGNRSGHGTRIGYLQQSSRGMNGANDPPRLPQPSSLKPKDALGMPWRVALALQADGWFLRSEIIWHKPNPFPESVKDRPTRSHEQVFLLSKSLRYYFNMEAISESSVYPEDDRHSRQKPSIYAEQRSKNGRKRSVINPVSQKKTYPLRHSRSVWSVPTEASGVEHYASMPQALAERCIRAGSKPGDVVFDPFMGSGTTALVARALRRHAIGIDLGMQYCYMAKYRLGIDDIAYWEGKKREYKEQYHDLPLFMGL